MITNKFYVFSRIKAIDDILEISIDDQLNSAPKIDDIFYVDGISDRDMEIARNNFNSYKAAMEVCWAFKR